MKKRTVGFPACLVGTVARIDWNDSDNGALFKIVRASNGWLLLYPDRGGDLFWVPLSSISSIMEEL